MFLGLSMMATLFSFISCGDHNNSQTRTETRTMPREDKQEEKGRIFNSGKLQVQKLTEHIYQHISFLETKDFRKVDCNGMIVVKGNEAMVFDTPADNESAEMLISFLKDSMDLELIAMIPTHFHEDCIGGIESFYKYQVPIHASARTLRLLKEKERKMPAGIQVFTDSLDLQLGQAIVSARYFGEGHTTDNLIGYFADEEVIFGGCLIKETGAGKGNLADANTKAWPETIQRIKKTYPSVKIIIPGHGKTGGPELLDYTIRLFQ